MRKVLVAAVATMLPIAAACSHEEDANQTEAVDMTIATVPETTTTAPAASQPVLESAVRAYTVAFLGGDPVAYSMLSERCRSVMPEADFTAIVQQAQAQYGEATITAYEDTVDGQVATASYELTDPTLNQIEERWLLEAGAWRNDDC